MNRECLTTIMNAAADYLIAYSGGETDEWFQVATTVAYLLRVTGQ